MNLKAIVWVKRALQTLLWVSVWALLFTVCLGGNYLPPGQTDFQKLWTGKMGIFFTIVYVLCLAFNIHKKLAKAVCWGLIVTGGIQAVWGILQIYGWCASQHPLFQLTGSFYNPGPYAGYLAFVFPLSLYKVLILHQLKQRSRIENVLYATALAVGILILAVLPASMSRSAWLAAFLTGLFVYIVQSEAYGWLEKQWKRSLKWGIIFSSFILIIGTSMVIGVFYLKKDSAMGRVFMWKITSLAIAEKPWAGYGPNSFPYIYGNAQEDYFASKVFNEQEELVAGCPQYAFNEYLQIALEYGCVVLVLILVAIAYCWIVSFKAKSIGFCGSILSFCIFAFFSYPTQFPGFVIAFLLVLLGSVNERGRKPLSVLILFTAIYSVYIYRDNRYKDCLQWSRNRILYETRSYAVAEKGYEQLYPGLERNGRYLFEYGRCLNKIKEYQKSIEILHEALLYNCDPMVLNIIGKNHYALQHYSEAEKYFIRSSHRLPNRIYPYYLLAKLYADSAFRQPDKFKTIADKVLYKQPKVYSKVVEEMREEIKKIAKERQLPL